MSWQRSGKCWDIQQYQKVSHLFVGKNFISSLFSGSYRNVEISPIDVAISSRFFRGILLGEWYGNIKVLPWIVGFFSLNLSKIAHNMR